MCRFHACDTILWLHIRRMLQSLVINRVAAGTEFLTLNLDSQSFDAIIEFIKQMDTAYIHPRRDSFHVSLCSKMYADFCAPANWVGNLPNVNKTEILPIRETKKNLSQTA